VTRTPDRTGHQGWQAKWPLSRVAVVPIAIVLGVGIFTYQECFIWTPLQRWYFNEYSLRADFPTTRGNYWLLMKTDRNGHHSVAGNSDVVPDFRGRNYRAPERAFYSGACWQIAERGETAIVYDPALEHTPQFFNPARGDLILNPLDVRCPYWSPSDEVMHEAEALTLATSLFPDKPHENTFFVEGPRKIFAHLLTLKPTPEELVRWMSHEEELDRLLKGTELTAFIYRGAGPQRGGVLGALNMVADSLKLLPKESETKQRWTTEEWARQRSGWIFLTSTPRFRERLLPLMSLWLDTLVLRLMNQGDPALRHAWFVLDELASLQRLPQLHTALTENRKSGNPVVIGFQGRSQLEVRYGHEAESMLSQPATKIFLHTSEPRAAKWISDTIGEVEMERVKETVNTHPLKITKSRSYHNERRTEPLVLPSEISGLQRLHALLKVDNLVVPFSFPYLAPVKTQPGFIPREITPRVVEIGKRTPQPKTPAAQELSRASRQELQWHR
jgi:hypothetical protein